MSGAADRVVVAILAKHLGASTDRAIGSCRRFGLPVYLGLTHEAPGAGNSPGVSAFRIDWRDDFAATRNALLSRIDAALVLWIDSDEELFSFPRLDWSRLPEDLFYIRTQFSAGLTPRVHVRMHRNRPDIGWTDSIHERLACLGPRPATSRFLSGLVLRHHGYEDDDTVLAKHERNRRIAERVLGAGGASYGARIAVARAEAAAGRPAAGLWLECYRQARAEHDPAVQPGTVGFEPALRLCMSGLTRPAEQLVEIDPLNLFLQVALIAARWRSRRMWDEERLDFVADCLANGICNAYENFPVALLGADRSAVCAYVREWVNEWRDGMEAPDEFDDQLVYRRKDGIETQEFDGDLLLMDPTTRKVVLLNPASTILWALLAHPHALRDLEAVLAAADPDTAAGRHREALDTLMRQLFAAGVILPVPPE